MSLTKGIEERIYAKADKELMTGVESAFDALRTALYGVVSGSNYPLSSKVKIKIKVGKDEHEAIRSVDKLLYAMVGPIVGNLKSQNRNNAVKAFMDKVDGLQDQLDELANEINFN